MVISLFKWLFIPVLFYSIPVGTGIRENRIISAHPFYVSVTEINHNAKDKTVEISCKMFTNDFETTINKYFSSKIDLSQPKDKTEKDKLVSAYIIKHLQFVLDGKPVTMQFIGSEKEDEATWTYFQVNDVPALKKIEITNSLMYDYYESEVNIMHVSVSSVKKSTKLSNPETKALFEF